MLLLKFHGVLTFSVGFGSKFFYPSLTGFCKYILSLLCFIIVPGVYGDVIRVKILYNKRDSALVQFREPQHAQTGEWVWSDTSGSGQYMELPS